MPGTLVLMCAGKSTRYPEADRPKWAQTHPCGNLMAAEAARGMCGFDRYVAVFAAADAARVVGHDVDRDGVVQALRYELEGTLLLSVDVVLLDDGGKSHAEDLSAALYAASVEGPFVAKDCDNSFVASAGSLVSESCATVAVSTLMGGDLVDPRNKSYVRLGDDGAAVEEVKEGVLLSSWFCCGAYGFPSARLYNLAREEVGARRLSEVVEALIDRDVRVLTVQANCYEDWGTGEAWRAYCDSFRTLFVDIDGVILKSGHRHFSPRWGEAGVLEKNVQYLNELQRFGRVDVVLTTARPESWRVQTVEQLGRAGLQWNRLIMGLPHAQRTVINDYHPGRAGRVAGAVQVVRDADDLALAMER